jgi:molybdate transport system substrate-binding protein
MRLFATLVGIILSTAVLAPAAHAADIKVLTAGAFKPVLLSQVAGFEQQTGHKLSVQNDTAGELLKRVRSGESFDLLILTQGGLEQLGRTGEVRADGIFPLARVGIGIAVKAGQPAPDVSSVDALRKSLLATRALTYMDPAGGSTSGAYLTGLFERMGIAQALKPKSVLVKAGLSAERLVSGEADIAIQQLSELIVVPGATVIGMLPAEVQNYTVYSGAVGARAAQTAAASQLLQWLRDARLKSELESRGLQTP